ncbi:hypothetical protein [Lutibaculum baratangense]|uniref:Uncharacterized protein n=1 Tax=Lutibaculum baratangense AMV1 TaxID=631454 RepID=V4TP78_9HYPH|nr:hypothetical protein [Lutibaculum baratangense]ESR27488.1 hypothetical protein N177_0011 [Lutibaculum baratangense AMV1]
MLQPRSAALSLAALALIWAETGATGAEASADPVELMDRAVEMLDRGETLEALQVADDAFFAVWQRLPLAFRRIELIDTAPEGYDRVAPREDNAYAPGQEISIYVDPVGFGWRQGGDGWETDLTADFILSTPEGRIIAGQKDFGEFRIRSPQRARESFLVINYRFTGVPAGDYILTTTVHDRIDEEEAAFETAIEIRPDGAASTAVR